MLYRCVLVVHFVGQLDSARRLGSGHEQPLRTVVIRRRLLLRDRRGVVPHQILLCFLSLTQRRVVTCLSLCRVRRRVVTHLLLTWMLHCVGVRLSLHRIRRRVTLLWYWIRRSVTICLLLHWIRRSVTSCLLLYWIWRSVTICLLWYWIWRSVTTCLP